MQIVRFKEGANLQVNMDLTLTKNNMFKLLKIIYSSCAKCWKMEFQKYLIQSLLKLQKFSASTTFTWRGTEIIDVT